MNSAWPDPFAVLGLDADAGPAEITAAYRRAVRDCHPDTAHPDRDRLAAVIAAYRRLRGRASRRKSGPEPRTCSGEPVPVRVRRAESPPPPGLRAGPVRRHFGHGERT
ncbi:J domain-containing protein [Amycolatopsis sp. K13G38]|uniref:J domain-containing protein n=1 Tax=Amycolatopsis acididurans TaxID=2724524 RepID=A0ABX1IZB7_9PSEU|nr:J domain-containing protein [Amycolatopsis acididurans]NKQ52873.1 J domain-containing protein [Amycolatopsis acididurans]